MPPTLCQSCQTSRALILRPKNHTKLCRPCFLSAFESEIHDTITTHNLFKAGERIAIGASGGKDSTVLASVLKTLNDRHSYGLDLILLSIDEGITGYRDDSLETVKRNAQTYDLPLQVLGYKELYGWTMDEVVGTIGKKGNCTYCGVFRRQALDRGAARLGVKHVVTGHNADDVAETVMMNLLRGDLPRLARATSIITESASSPIKRSKPLKYAYEKEIVLYAHHKKLDYFSTECIYSPEAFRGSARSLIKNLERIRPSAIVDVVRSGEDMARCVPQEVSGTAPSVGNGAAVAGEDEEAENEGGCGSSNGRASGGEMAEMERQLQEHDKAEEREVEVTGTSVLNGQRHDRDGKAEDQRPRDIENGASSATQAASNRGRPNGKAPRRLPKQQLGKCQRCGYISSQAICKACALLEGLNKNRPSREIGDTASGGVEELPGRLSGVSLTAENG
ncbi:MAG: nucleotidyltransferase [Alyxoria varia]|nr:MAG: nucleotidyltransferase [Alyxoria varia]